MTANDLRTAIVALADDSWALVLKNLGVNPGTEQEKAIHDLRVAVKKIRTVFRLVQFIDPVKFHQRKQIAKLRKLFRAAGVLRELEVSAGMVRIYETSQNAVYRRASLQLVAEKRSAQPLYEMERKAFDVDCFGLPRGLIHEVLGETTEAHLCRKAEELYLLRLRQMHGAMPPAYEPELIHQARIHLKEAVYLMGLLHDSGHADRLQPGFLDAAKAAEIAGNWHDREVFHEWLLIQVRHGAPLHRSSRHYRPLMQVLHAQTRAQAEVFRKSLMDLEGIHTQAASKVPAESPS
jgi:CHAD domain-containing protein